jgi:glycosyltransferase involved in cell wall biosynthesis
MRIAILTHSIGYGGVEKNIAFLSERLLKEGNSVLLVYIKGIIPSYMEKERMAFNSTIELLEIEAGHQKGFRRLSQIKKLINVLSLERVDIIIGFTKFPNFMASWVGKRLKKPVIIAERGDPFRDYDKSFVNKLLLKIICSADGAVFQTIEASSFYPRKLQDKSQVIPNPIFLTEVPNIAPFENRNKTIVSIGRLDNVQKRYDVMLDAFKVFSAIHGNYELLIYGSGLDEELIKKWIKEKSLEDKARMMGVSKKPIMDMAKEGIFLITSDYEGISNSLLEAMAIGMPVVSTDSTPGGARMLISDHINGIIVPVGDAKAIANALCEYVENPELALRCGDEAKKVLTDFSKERIFSLWYKYIQKVYNDYYHRP